MDFGGTWRHELEAVRAPAHCAEIELAEPLTDVVAPGYRSVHALVRLHGEPVGVVSAPLVGGRCSASTLVSSIIDRLGPKVVRAAVRHAIEAPLDALPLGAERLAQPPATSDAPLPSVTVAVCTRGRPDGLAACLAAIRRLDHPDVEVIVVDNSPVGGAVERLVREQPHMRYLREPGSGLDRARNRAIVAATRDIIAFTDDDVVVDPGWARALAHRLGSSPEVHAVTGLVMPLELDTEAQVLFELYLGFARGFERRWWEDAESGARSIALRHGNTGRLGTGASMAFRRSVLTTVGGFDPALDLGTATNGGGDLDMFFRVIKAGGTLVYEPSAVVRHRHRRELHELQEQLRNWGTAMRSYMERNRLAYPEERVPFGVLMCWLLSTWHLRRLLSSAAHHHPAARLVTAEMRGLLGGRHCYDRARALAEDVARSFGPSEPRPRSARLTMRGDVGRDAEVIDHAVDLAEPLASFTHTGDASTVRLTITFRGRRVARTTFTHRGHTVSVARLRDVAAVAAGNAIGGRPFGVRRSGRGGRELAARIVSALQARTEATRRSGGWSRGLRRSQAGGR